MRAAPHSRKDFETRQKDLEALARTAGAFAAIFTVLAGASLGGVLPKVVSVIAGCVAVAALIATFLFTAGARRTGLKMAALDKKRARAELRRGAPVSAVQETDPTQIGVDRAAQDILPGGEVPEYIVRDVDRDVRKALEAALDGSGRWLVVVEGPSKVGKSRTLFEALKRCAYGREVDLVAPVDGHALRKLIASDDGSTDATHTVLWLDDLEPFLDAGVTLATVRDWHDVGRGRIVAATYGGKGSERIVGSTAGGLATIAAEVLQSAREIWMTASTTRELGARRSELSDEQFASVERHGLAAYLVAAPALERKLYTRRHAPGEPECLGGAAVVVAAVDWARCGRTDPIADDVLRELWPHYLPGGAVAADDEFIGALVWAIRPVAGTIALLTRTGSYQAFDYVVRLVRDRLDVDPPCDAAWVAAVRSATDGQALAVGSAAYAHARFGTAADAFSRARQSSIAEVAALAGCNLGVVLRDLDRSEDALGVYDEVVARYGEAPEPALRERVARALVDKGFTLGELGRFEDALGVYDEVVARYGEAPEPALRERVATALVNKGLRLGGLGRFEDALGVYDEVVARYGEAPEPALRERVATALVNKGLRLGGLRRFEDALGVYDEVVARYGEAPEPALREQAATALVNKGFRLRGLGRSKDQLGVYDEVVARYGEAPEPALRERVATALVNKGLRLRELRRFEDELGVYDEVVARYGKAPEPALRERVATALVNKGLRLQALGRSEDELGVYDELVARYGEAPESALREQAATALVNKGLRLGGLARSKDTLGVYDEVVARYGEAPEPALRERVATALINKGFRLLVLGGTEHALGRYEDALRVYDEVVARYGEAPEPALREQAATALVNKGYTLRELGRFEDALGVYDEVVARYGEAPEPALRERVATALVNKGLRLQALGRYEDALGVYDEVVARYGEAPEPALRERVAKALVNKGLRRGS